MIRSPLALLALAALATFAAPLSFEEVDAAAVAAGPLPLFFGALAGKGLLPYLPHHLMALLLSPLPLPAAALAYLARFTTVALLLASFVAARRDGGVAARLLVGAPLIAVVLAGFDFRHLAAAALCASAALIPRAALRLVPASAFVCLAPRLALLSLPALPLFALPALLARMQTPGFPLAGFLGAASRRVAGAAGRFADRTHDATEAREASLGHAAAMLARMLQTPAGRWLSHLVPLLVLLALALPGMFHEPWADERFTAQFLGGERTFAEKTVLAAHDVHPPLYYGIVALAGEVLPATPFVLRLPSLFAVLVGLHCTLRLTPLLTPSPLAPLALGLPLAMHPLLVRLAAEGRMYGLMFGLSALLLLLLSRGRMNAAVACALALTWTNLVGALAALATLTVHAIASARRRPGPVALTLLVLSTAAFALFCLTREPLDPPGVVGYRPAPFALAHAAETLLDVGVFLLHGVDARNHGAALRAAAIPSAVALLALFLPACLARREGRALFAPLPLVALALYALFALFEYRAGLRYFSPLLPAFALCLLALPFTARLRRASRLLAWLALALFILRHLLLFLFHPACGSGERTTAAAFVATTGGLAGRVLLRERSHLYDRSDAPAASAGEVPLDGWIRARVKGPMHAFELIRFGAPPPAWTPLTRPVSIEVGRLPLVRLLGDGTVLVARLIDREAEREFAVPFVKRGTRFEGVIPLSGEAYAYLDLSFERELTHPFDAVLASFTLPPLPVFAGRGAAGRPHVETPLPFEDPFFLWLPLALALACPLHEAAARLLARLTGARKACKIGAR